MGSISRDNQGEAQGPQSNGITPFLEQMAQPETWDFLKCNQKEHFVSVQNVLNINIIIENAFQNLSSTLTCCGSN